MLFRLHSMTFFVGFIILTRSFALNGQDTNKMDSKWWLAQKSIVWSAEINHFRAGIDAGPIPPEGQVAVWILSSNKTNCLYILPSKGITIMVLTDENGAVVPPINGKTDEELPSRVSVRKLVRYHDGPFGGHGIIYDYFLVGHDTASMLADFKISDVYDIKKAGEYKLTMLPAVYQLETNNAYADRVDFPVITTKVHLFPPN
jgi:hypothetical protein